MMTKDELVSNLADVLSVLSTALVELDHDPLLARNFHWRENLETSVYGMTSTLSDDLDEEES